MAGNPLEPFFQACESISHCVQTHLSRLFLPPQADSRHPHSLFKETSLPLFSVFSKPPSTTDDGSAPFRRKKEVFGRGPSSRRSVLSLGIVLPRVFFLHILQAKAAGPLTKEELGRATWTLLHAIAAQVFDQLPLLVLTSALRFSYCLLRRMGRSC